VWANFPCYQIFRILEASKFDFCRFVKPTFQGTSQRVEIFLIFETWKCVLHCRSIDGNWTDYWRKLHVLVKETGRSIYGNWMVWIRKLDGLLTETGWAIDGNWGVYWWKELSIDGSSPADFLHFGGLKMRFCRVPKPSVSWTLGWAIVGNWTVYWWKELSGSSPVQLILPILEARKFDFCRVVKPRVQDYQASCEQILRILASSKCDFWRFVKPTFLNFWGLKMRFAQ